MTLNADDRASLERLALERHAEGLTQQQILGELAWHPLVRPGERDEVRALVREALKAAR